MTAAKANDMPNTGHKSAPVTAAQNFAERIPWKVRSRAGVEMRIAAEGIGMSIAWNEL